MKRLTSLLLVCILCMTMIVPAFAAGSLTFDQPDPKYQSKAFITDTNACVVTKVTKPKGSGYTASGLILKDQFGNEIANHWEAVKNVGKNSTAFHVWFDINKELGRTLTPGTRYTYQFYGKLNNQWIYSSEYSLKTTGNAPLYTLELEPDGGVVRPISIQLHTGDRFGDLPVPVRGGYEFNYWSFNGKKVTPDTVFTLSSDSVLIAHWTELKIPEKIPELPAEPDIPEPPAEPEPPVVPEPPEMEADIRLRGNISADHTITVDPEHRGVTAHIPKAPGRTLSEARMVILDLSGNEVVSVGLENQKIRNASTVNIMFRLDSEEVLERLDSIQKGECYFAATIDGEVYRSRKSPFVNGFYGLPRIVSTFWLNPDHTGSSYKNCQFPGRKYSVPAIVMTIAEGSIFNSWGTRSGTEIDNNTTVTADHDMDFYIWTTKTGSTGFTDVKSGDWFRPYVTWAVQNRITVGVGNGKFAPNAKCQTSHIITFLWNANGQPEPDVNRVFHDVDPSDWFDRSSRWAYEMGILEDGWFNGSSDCTRADAVTYLWKLAGKPDAPASHFKDVSRNDACAAAVDWAFANHVTAGYDDGRFGVNDTCTRAQIAGFLKNYAENVRIS